MKISRRGKALLALVPALAVVGVVVAQSVYFSTTNTFTIGQAFQVNSAEVGYNLANLETGTYTFCTLATSPAWTCPNPTASTIFAGDVITWAACVETDKTGVTPILAVNAGTFTAFTTSVSYDKTTGMCTGFTGLQSGTPTMSAGSWYYLFISATISPGAPTGSVSFSPTISA